MDSLIEKVNLEDFNILDTMNIWDEAIELDEPNSKFSMYGTGTFPIPPFHLNNLVYLASTISVNEHQYTDIKGHNKLLESVARNMKKFYHRDINPAENVIITEGANKAVSTAIQAHVEDGDEVLFFEPYYTNHLNDMSVGKTLRITVCPLEVINCQDSDGKEYKQFKFNVENFKKAMNSNVKLVIMINPHNPSGYVFSQKDFEEITKVLEDYPRTIVIEDNSYFIYLEEGTKLNYFSEIGNNFNKSYNVFSAGKLFNTHGLRVGWTIAGKDMIQPFYETRHKSFNFVSALEQFTIAKNLDDMFNDYKDGKDYPNYTKDLINDSIEKLADILRKHEIVPFRMMGTYYLMADISKVVDKIPSEYYTNLKTNAYDPNPDKAFCRKLLLDYKIGFVPMSSMTFNCFNFNTLVRISANRNDDDMKMVDEALTDMLSNK